MNNEQLCQDYSAAVELRGRSYKSQADDWLMTLLFCVGWEWKKVAPPVALALQIKKILKKKKKNQFLL